MTRLTKGGTIAASKMTATVLQWVSARKEGMKTVGDSNTFISHSRLQACATMSQKVIIMGSSQTVQVPLNIPAMLRAP